jgi:beta-lactamase superfamily II metal-dependent hydrolase
MYRQGLGDCFLLTFDPGGAEKHVLIDCGTLGNKATDVTTAVLASEIKAATGNHLDLLIATHEHKDHLSGFANETLKKLPADRVWLAWTENPADPLAKQLAKTREDLGRTLTAAAEHLGAAGARSDLRAIATRVRGVLGFSGNGDGLGFAKTIHALMEEIRKRPEVSYLEPGEPAREEAWLPGFRIYVLGPPRDKKALGETGEHGSSELYGLMASLKTALAFRASGQSFGRFERDHAARDLFEQQMPFDPRFRTEMKSRAAREWFAKSYFAAGEKWRAVDEDWLSVLSELALQLDSATNNTSLVIAVERIADGKVLLLPGDAQEGSWLSWHASGMEWDVTDAANRKRKVTAADLLARTVFYKVGHHASHNATARGKGLELMTSDELVAFIPVDREIALSRSPKGSWKMPARALYRRLLEKCEGRVARSDLGWAGDSAVTGKRTIEKEFDHMASAVEWKTWTRKQKEAETNQVVRVGAREIDFVMK